MAFEREFWEIRPDPNQPPLSEEEMIHTVLEYVATKLPKDNPTHIIDPAWVFNSRNLNSFFGQAVHRMLAEGLITTETSNQTHSRYIIRATTYGIRLANHPGGYRANLATQRNLAAQEQRVKYENERLSQDAARATIDAAQAAKLSVSVSERALRVSKIGTAIASLIAIAAIVAQVVSSNNAAADSELTKSQIKELQKQVSALSSSPKPPPKSPVSSAAKPR
jgi:hypothetical protein